jgi:hypothetical protein
LQVKTAHQLQAAHALAGRTAEAAAMAQLVGRKMADITEARRSINLSIYSGFVWHNLWAATWRTSPRRKALARVPVVLSEPQISVAQQLHVTMWSAAAAAVVEAMAAQHWVIRTAVPVGIGQYNTK